MWESDSKTTLHFIAEGLVSMHLFYPMVQNIQVFLDKDWHLQFQHTLREANSCADILAKQGPLEDHRLIILDTSPLSLSSKLIVDALGVIFTRNNLFGSFFYLFYLFYINFF